MTDEEKKAIDDLFSLTHINGYINLYDQKKASIYTSDLKRWQNGVKVLLNLIQKQQAEINALQMEHNHDVKMIDEVKGEAVRLYDEIKCLKSLHNTQVEIIDEMAKTLKWSFNAGLGLIPASICDCEGDIRNCEDKICTDCIKEYFKKKVEDK